MKKSHHFWLAIWYAKSKWGYLFLPLSWLFAALSVVRKYYLVNFVQRPLAVPVIVVGNISVGGTGKTPLIIELVKYLQQHGYKPGVISRGYGGQAQAYPYLLHSASLATESGDEPLLIYRATGCAVCVAPDRVAAAEWLIAQGCNLILSDDGLQHYRLARAMEIAVVDGQRVFGNGRLLPAGPLREPVARLNTVDLIVVNNPAQMIQKELVQEHFAMQIQPLAWRQIHSQQQLPLKALEFKTQIHALAGIGNPGRFFKTLDAVGLHYYAHQFPDHHTFTASDFDDFHDDMVLMTEKDAVKCQSFAKPNWYSLLVSAHLPECFWQAFQHKLDSIVGR